MLVDDLRVKQAVGAMWRYREQVEREAAALFDTLAADLAAAHLPALAARARTAADDERRHVGFCRAIVDATDPLPPLPPRHLQIGPTEPDPGRRALYASVAMGCVTESLSCALLLAMREPADFAPACAAIDLIIKDEIEHSRIGWAHLATAAGTGDVSWLAPHVAAMRDAALTHDVADRFAAEDLDTARVRSLGTAPDLSAYGILPRARVTEVVDACWRDVIVPGLARYGL